MEGDHKQAVEACTRGEPSRASIIDDANTRPALKDNPTYEKALRRRIDSNEALNSWTSLTAAQEGEFCGYRMIACIDSRKITQHSSPLWNPIPRSGTSRPNFEG
mgnify:CR=1 FL=1